MDILKVAKYTYGVTIIWIHAKEGDSFVVQIDGETQCNWFALL